VIAEYLQMVFSKFPSGMERVMRTLRKYHSKPDASFKCFREALRQRGQTISAKLVRELEGR